VTLTVTTAVGSDEETHTDYIEVLCDAPAAAFAAEPSSGLCPLSVQFTDLSYAGSSPITSWLWDFGDGAQSAEQHPSHVYTEGGLYTVGLTVTTEVASDSETREDFIEVFCDAPAAEFTAEPTSGVCPLDVSFTDASSPGSAPITSWAWDFGDGAQSAEQNPSHSYAESGLYTVSLTVTTDVGSDTETKTDFIAVACDPPVADFSAEPTSGTCPLVVDFTDASEPGSLPITSWLWDFGDGAQSTEQNPSHSYAEAGLYTVTLTVTTDVGSDDETKVDFIAVACDPPVADFTGTPTTGVCPLAVSFTDASAPGSAPITSWLWDFGDGGQSIEQNPSHSYTDGGTYTVTLTVTTSVGQDSEVKTDYISVICLPPTAEFAADPIGGCEPLNVQFTDLSDPGSMAITSWLWDFGDGDQSTESDPSHLYGSDGTYTVSLTVSSGAGQDTETKTDLIQVAPCVINVTSPSQGAAWALGSQHLISWVSSCASDAVRIELYDFGEFVREIASTANDGEYLWFIDVGLPESAGYQIRVIDNANEDCWGESGPFLLYRACQITVTSPEEGEELEFQSTVQIRWQYENASNWVDVELYNNGEFVHVIVDNLWNLGSLTWRVDDYGQGEGCNFQIRVSDATDPQCLGFSGSFCID
jgi:PKD repeat protein